MRCVCAVPSRSSCASTDCSSVSTMQPIHTPTTPELSMDGSYGGSDEGDIALNDIEVGQYVNDDAVTTVIIKQASTASSATWPLETIAVEGNHWIH